MKYSETHLKDDKNYMRSLLKLERPKLEKRTAFEKLVNKTTFFRWINKLQPGWTEERLWHLDYIDIDNIGFTSMGAIALRYIREEYGLHADVNILDDDGKIYWQFNVYDYEDVRENEYFSNNDGMCADQNYNLVLAYCLEYLTTKITNE